MIRRTPSSPFGAPSPRPSVRDALRGALRLTRAVVQARVQRGVGSRTMRCDGTVALSLSDGACPPGGVPVNVLRANGKTYQLPGQLGIGGNGGALASTSSVLSGLGGRLFAGTDEDTAGVLGFYRSTDHGASWAGRPGVSGAGGSVLALTIAASGTLFAAVGTAGVYHSADGGTTWLGYTSGLAGTDVRSVACSADGLTVLAGTFASGLFQSIDGGLTWGLCTVLGHGLDATTRVYSVVYLRNGIALVSTEQRFVDIDGEPVGFGGLCRLSGRAWVRLTFPGVAPVVGVNAWGVDRWDAGFATGAWLALDNIGDGYCPLYTTTSSGISFLATYPIFGDYARRGITALAPDLLSPRSSYSASISSVCYAGGDTSGLYDNGVVKTTDGGTTWNTSLIMDGVSTLAIDPRNHARVFAGARAGNGIFASLDAGDNWDDVSAGLDAAHGGTNVNALVTT